MSERYRIALLPGDGIGPEVTTATRTVVDATGLGIEWLECRAGHDFSLPHDDVRNDASVSRRRFGCGCEAA